MYLCHSAIDCGPAPILLDSIPLRGPSQETTFGVHLGYKCVNGYWFGRNRYTEVATCTATGLWEAAGETKLSKMPVCIRKL